MYEQQSRISPDLQLTQIVALLHALDAKVEAVQAVLGQHRKDLLTVAEFAELVGRSAYTTRRWIAEGRVRATRVNGTGSRGRLLVPRTELDRVVQMGVGEAVPASATG